MRVIVPLVLSVVFAILGALVAYVLTTILTDWIAGLAGMSNFEGGRGYFAGLVVGPIGGFVGLIAGAAYGWRLGRRPPTETRVLSVVVFVGVSLGFLWYVWTYA